MRLSMSHFHSVLWSVEPMNEKEWPLFWIEGPPQRLALNTLFGTADNAKNLFNRRRSNGPIYLHHVFPSQ
jgi:hypothetical protein